MYKGFFILDSSAPYEKSKSLGRGASQIRSSHRGLRACLTGVVCFPKEPHLRDQRGHDQRTVVVMFVSKLYRSPEPFCLSHTRGRADVQKYKVRAYRHTDTPTHGQTDRHLPMWADERQRTRWCRRLQRCGF